jgi:hypothetical protein
MSLNFSNSPYWDDFNTNKNFYRVLFKPGYAVQARELTQLQTIAQSQVTKLGDHIFKNHSVVSGAKCTVNINVNYIKLNDLDPNGFEIIAKDFLNAIINSSDGSVVAKVLNTSEKQIDNLGNLLEPPTLIVSYMSGDNFTSGSSIVVSGSELTATVISEGSIYQPAVGPSSIASITDGVFYINGIFASIQQQTVNINEYSNTPSARIGISIVESIVNSSDDPTLLDPALGSSNFQAPGADRYAINLVLTTKPLTLDQDSNFIELIRIENGVLAKNVVDTQYSVIDDYFAKRSFDTNGDYVSNKFKLTPKANPDTANADSTFIVTVGKGKAYIRGYSVENTGDYNLVVNRARDTASVANKSIYLNYGNHVYCNNVTGFFDFKSYTSVDIHCTPVANTNNTTSQTYSSTIAATAKVRGMQFVFAENYNKANTFVYEMFLTEIQNNVLSDSAANTSANTITFPSYFSDVNNAYVGTYVKIISGENNGDIAQIVSYDGSSRKAYLLGSTNGNFKYLPETNCQFSILFGTKDFESLYNVDDVSKNIKAQIYPTSKVDGLPSGDTILRNAGNQELIYRLENNYIVPDSITGTSYYSWIRYTNQPINVTLSVSGSGVMEFQGGSDGVELSVDKINENFICVVRNPGTGHGLKVGDIFVFQGISSNGIKLAASGGYSGALATITVTGYSDVYVDIFAKVYINNADNTAYIRKSKVLNSANLTSVAISGTQVVPGEVFVDTVNSQVYIANNSFNTASQSLYISDVTKILKIIDTGVDEFGDPRTATSDMIPDPTYDVTRYYTFSNGQGDNFYDHASIKLIPGSPPPVGNILVLLSYYDHTGGDGFFTAGSYTDVRYEDLPSYVGKSSGTLYNLRDCIDFRSRRKNANSEFIIDSNISNPIGIPIDETKFTLQSSYFLGRKDVIVISKDKNISLIQGISDLNPKEPNVPEGAMLLGKLTLEPYTAYLPSDNLFGGASSVSLEYVNHKRWRMEDITTLEDRINRLEYYASLNLLEQSATNIQISDEFGNNRFKNGIMTDDFSSYNIADTTNPDLACSISQVKKRLFARTNVQNFPLFVKDSLLSFSRLDATTLSGKQYALHNNNNTTYVSLPYTKVSVARQPYATSTVNINPFMFITKEGVCELSPHMDNWISTTKLPDLLIVNPNTTLYLQSNTVNYLADYQTISSSQAESKTLDKSVYAVPSTASTGVVPANMTEQQIIDFMNVYGGEKYYTVNGKDVELSVAKTAPLNSPLSAAYLSTLRSAINVFIYRKYAVTGQWSGIGINDLTKVTTTTTSTTSKTDVWGMWESLGNSYQTTNGYITDVSMNPYIRAQQIEISTSGLLVNTPVSAFFDNTDVTTRFKQSNVLRVWSNPVTARGFKVGDIIAYYNSATTSFVPFAKVLNLSTKTSVSNSSIITGTRLYQQNLDLVWDIDATVYVKDKLLNYDIFAISFNTSGAVTGLSATGVFISIDKKSGKFLGQTSNTIIIPNVGANTSNIIGKILYQITDSYEIKFPIVNAYESGNTIIITTNVNLMANTLQNTVYDIKSNNLSGMLKTDEYGKLSGVFYLPADQFHTGEKLFRIDNRIAKNIGTETTFAQGTFFATSLSTKSQNLDFAPDISSARNTLTRTEIATKQVITQTVSGTVTTVNYHDPLCQSFILYSDVTPNGVFVKSLRFFFKTVPQYDTSPVTVSILGTTNGYPNGDTLPYAIKTLSVDEIKYTDAPNIDDALSYTEFEFDVPVYIKPDTMYAVMVKSNSNEYTLWKAVLGETAISSTTPGLQNIRISSSPYIGSLYESQNAITWTANQNEDLMFDMIGCQFDITKNPTIDFIVPAGLPKRKLVDNSLVYSSNLTSAIDSSYSGMTAENVLVSSFNVTTTDLSFDVAPISYTYKATKESTGALDSVPTLITPGRFGTATLNDVDLGDGNGNRILLSSAANSFILSASISSSDKYLSPIISEAGTSLYATQYIINNLEFTSSNITIANSGIGYSNSSIISVRRTSNTSGSDTLLSLEADANGKIYKINTIFVGTGYASTPEIVITDANRGGNANAVLTVTGETSSIGGNAALRYISKPVTLHPGFDAGDLRIYFTAYRPINTDVFIYYKILNRNDTQLLVDSDWQLMTLISGRTTYSSSKNELIEYIAAPGIDGIPNNTVTYTSKATNNSYIYFYQFAIKVVLVSNDSTIIPFLTDIRTIALPPMIPTAV